MKGWYNSKKETSVRMMYKEPRHRWSGGFSRPAVGILLSFDTAGVEALAGRR